MIKSNNNCLGAANTNLRSRLCCLLLLLCASCWNRADGFLSGAGGTPRQSTIVSQLLQSSGSETIAKADSHGRTENLVFHADVSISSDPLPEGIAKKDALAYLRAPETRNMLLSAGGTRPVHEVPMSDELEQLWKDCCSDSYGSEYLPKAGDVILACDSITQFPGVKLVTTVYSGVKKAESETDSSQYTFLMVGEEQSVSGVLKGIFNKLTGNDKKGNSLKPSGRAKSVISVVDAQDNRLTFNFDASIDINVEFPAFLLKILPVSKEKAEAQGSTSISKAISKDAQKAVVGAYESFLSTAQ